MTWIITVVRAFFDILRALDLQKLTTLYVYLGGQSALWL